MDGHCKRQVRDGDPSGYGLSGASGCTQHIDEGCNLRVVAQQLDVMPTVLAWAGVPAPPGLPGRDVTVELDGGELEGVREPGVISYLRLEEHEVLSLWYRDRHLIRWNPRRGGSAEALFEVDRDPGESVDPGDRADLWRALLGRRLAASWRGSRPPRSPLDAADSETQRQLRALGYF